MLKKMREGTKSIFAGALLWAVIIALSVYVFVNWGAKGQIGTPTSVIAWFDGNEIQFQEYVRKARDLEDYYRRMYGKAWSSQLAKAFRIQRRAFDSIINRRVELYHAKQMGISASKEEVAKRILSYPVFVDKNGNFIGFDKYKRYLNAYGYRVSDFERGVKEDIIIEKLENLYRESVQFSVDELRDIYEKQNVSIAFDYAVFNPKNYVNKVKVNFTDEQMKKYYENHKDKYKTPLMRRIKFVVFNPFVVGANVKISDAEIKDYYEKNKDKYTQEEQVRAKHILISSSAKKISDAEAKKLAEKIYNQLKKGADFDKLAKKYSDDPGTKNKGGDLGFFPKGRMVKPFEDAAFSLKVGQISKPVKTRYGYHIIKVTGKKKAKTFTLDEVKEEIKSILKAKRTQDLANQKAKEFEELAKKYKSIEKAAKEMKIKVNDSGFFENSPSANIKGLGTAGFVANYVFSMKKNEISNPLRTAEGFVVCQMVEEKKPETPAFDQVKDKVLEDLKIEEARKIALKEAEKFRAKVTYKNFDKVAKKNKLSIRKQRKITMEQVNSAFILKPASDEVKKLFKYDKDQITEPLLDKNGNYIVCKITEKVNFDQKKFMKELPSLRERIRNEEAMKLVTSMVANLRKKLTEEGKIEVRPEFLQRLREAESK
ncbi:peptidyl-prolyl cis-trans isomerase D [Thermotomaculum hydrothermale]|uniref:Periplasmic chaperone PpiD n=1 Tax=Thermotomaculum hydrothermale TaxID=981385 RepID=A0A7R6PLR2_9BACT|nr:peptidyl-prolyl cis-trans isomerase [Thermotomaculum hydrothermale]BBB31898.1 peptidyl-prolyl cis-trans isomerase D [Thermotomaculum hydrothermale]